MIKDMFSVIVPVYNVEQFLPNCIESILRQIFPKYEVILVDDGSTDGSGKICDDYASKHEIIKVVHQENKGLSGARNTGIRLAKGEYICFVDSDDYIEKELLSKTYYYLSQGYDMVSFCARRVDENRNAIYEMRFDKDFIRGFDMDEYGKNRFIYKDFLNYKLGWEAWINVYKHDIIEMNQMLFDENIKFAEDKVFTLWYLGYVNRIKKIPDIVYNYTERSNSLTHGDNYTREFAYFHNSINDIMKVITMGKDNKCMIYIGVTLYYYMKYMNNNPFNDLISLLQDYKDDIISVLSKLDMTKRELIDVYGESDANEVIRLYKKIYEELKNENIDGK